MASFWIVATLMTLVAMAFVLVPLLRARARSTPSRHEANLAVLRGQRRELEADVASGLLLPADRDTALAELVARASDDLEPQAQPAADARKPWVAAAAVALAIPALAFGIYAATGNPAASDAKVVAAAAAAHPPDSEQMLAMVETLAAKMRERPDDPQGWALLARSMAAMGRFKESADAYEHLAKLVPNDADVLADYADALGMAQGRSLAGRPTELIREALRINPQHGKALALAGTAALDRGDFAAATKYWEQLASQLPADSADRAQVLAVLAEIRERAQAAGKPLPASRTQLAKAQPPPSPPPSASPQPSPKGAGTNVTGSVSVAPAIAKQVTGTETLFIFARAEGGPRVPLAVVRAAASELPMAFTLDDTQSMAPDMKISTAAAIRVEARISKSGMATPQPGDLVGASTVVKPGASGVKVVVDKVLP
jgi:cytochrome c-type biogenesis protein CcmH